jgi:hypothetical protein
VHWRDVNSDSSDLLAVISGDGGALAMIEDEHEENMKKPSSAPVKIRASDGTDNDLLWTGIQEQKSTEIRFIYRMECHISIRWRGDHIHAICPCRRYSAQAQQSSMAASQFSNISSERALV